MELAECENTTEGSTCDYCKPQHKVTTCENGTWIPDPAHEKCDKLGKACQMPILPVLVFCLFHLDPEGASENDRIIISIVTVVATVVFVIVIIVIIICYICYKKKHGNDGGKDEGEQNL